jgi:uncharacterized protein
MHSNPLAWRHSFRSFPQLAVAAVILLGLGFALMRAFGALGSVFGSPSLRALLPLSFVLMAITPWLFLSARGRQQIGLARANSAMIYVWAAATGALLALACGVIGSVLFGTTQEHWFVSAAQNFQQSFNTQGKSTLLLFLVFTLPALTFSPVGEEIFFRGLLQRSLEETLPENASTTLECAAFAVVHLCHHGLFWSNGQLSVLWPSALLWVAFMFVAARLFAHWRKTSGSVFPAMVSHMAFNAVMSVYIFSVIWGKFA